MTATLQVANLCKRFGPTVALDHVALTAHSGRVLALIGENGAGKSTLLKTLSGAHPCDSGTMELDGLPYRPAGPIEARRRGVAIVYQELTLAPELSVEDNVMLGRTGTGGGLLWRSRQRGKVVQALHRVGLEHLSPTARTGDQSVATQQLIEVARALVGDARTILFDEPTSSLPSADVDRLFKIIDQLRSDGLAIIYISHFLEEVRRIADDYAVLRDGKSVGQGVLSEITDEQIVSLMVGRDVDELFPSVPHSLGETRMTLRELSSVPIPNQINVSLRAGEIFGVAGLVGAGRTELLRCLYAMQRVTQGSVTLDDKPLPETIAARRKAGLGLLSEDRKSEGLAQNLSITENLMMGNNASFSTAGWLNLSLRSRSARHWMEKVEVKARDADQSVSELSGGNQQKVAIGRLLAQDADVYLLDEPTKGIDVGTKAEIYRMMGELAAKGKTVVFVSSYLPELLAVCDTIGVMSRGSLVEVRAANEWNEHELLAAAISAVEER